jgi:lipid II:glycine glycyltransferase (peptidoglycan interpeptide bridge formation enzyme)
MRRFLGEKFRLYIVRLDGDVIGGMIVVTAPSILTSLYVAIHHDFLGGYPTYLLYWRAIAGACKANAGQFDLGRSVKDSGTHNFKRQWAGADEIVNYTSRFASKPGAIKETRQGGGLANKIWSLAPVPLVDYLGPIIRRRMPFA